MASSPSIQDIATNLNEPILSGDILELQLGGSRQLSPHELSEIASSLQSEPIRLVAPIYQDESNTIHIQFQWLAESTGTSGTTGSIWSTIWHAITFIPSKFWGFVVSWWQLLKIPAEIAQYLPYIVIGGLAIVAYFVVRGMARVEPYVKEVAPEVAKAAIVAAV